LGDWKKRFGKDAFYVHLRRNAEAVARSYNNRWSKIGIISAYRNGILMGAEGADPYDVCVDLVDTIEANISAFLADKPRKMTFNMETAERDWRDFWNAIGAEGDLDASLAEWRVAHNPSPPKKSLVERAIRKAIRLPQELRA